MRRISSNLFGGGKAKATELATELPTRPNLPVAVSQIGPEAGGSATGAPVAAPAADALSESQDTDRDAAETAGPAYEAPVGKQHLLSAREMIAHPTRTPSEVVVHLMGVLNLPRMPKLNLDSLTPYVVAWVIDHRGQRAGETVRWAPRADTRQPVWNSGRRLALPPMSYRRLRRAVLHAQVWEWDALLPHTLVGQCAVPLMSLLSPSHVDVPLSLASEAEQWPEAVDQQLLTLAKKTLNGAARLFSPAAAPTPRGPNGRAPDCALQLRLLGSYPTRKWLYLVRHGESEWNRAQASYNVATMYSQVDHPLSPAGIEQATRLAEKLQAVQSGQAKLQTAEGGASPPGPAMARLAAVGATSGSGEGAGDTDGSVEAAAFVAEAERRLCAAQQVLCSPLSRAVETCVVGLAPLLGRGGLPVVLTPAAREHFRGGADSMGCALGGDAVRERVRQQLLPLCGGDAARVEALLATPFDDREVSSRWWSAMPETQDELKERLTELMRQVRYSPHEHVVLVGHSLFIRELFRELVSPERAASTPQLDALRRLKLQNCGVVCAELDLAEPTTPIVRAALMLGSELEGKKDKEPAGGAPVVSSDVELVDARVA